MKEDQFIKENADVWRQLENYLTKIRSRGFRKFKKDELNQFIKLYDRSCSHLSYSRTHFGNANTTVYLNRLVATAHGYIYTNQTSNFKKFILFFIRDFPLLIRRHLWFFLLSTSLFVFGTLLSYIYTCTSMDNAVAFLDKNLISSINLDKDATRSWDAYLESTEILTNNIRVGFVAFVLGITLGTGTVWVLIKNGILLGGIAGIAQHEGAHLVFWSLILPHGVLELFAIFVCGAAGLMIGYSIIHPGSYSRKDAIIIHAKIAIQLILGTIPIFFIAGIIEGFFTPLKIPEYTKLLFAAFTLILLALYMVIPNIVYRKYNQQQRDKKVVY